MKRVMATLSVLIAAASCASNTPGPAPLDTRNEHCGFCEMVVSDASLASQLVAPGEEPRFFDDLGCLSNYVRTHDGGMNAVGIYVADHRTRAWVEARLAIFTRVDRLETPMGSHLIAHGTIASRDDDPAARGGVPVSFDDVLAGVPASRPSR